MVELKRSFLFWLIKRKEDSLLQRLNVMIIHNYINYGYLSYKHSGLTLLDPFHSESPSLTSFPSPTTLPRLGPYVFGVGSGTVTNVEGVSVPESSPDLT